jgi:hypothetical protein
MVNNDTQNDSIYYIFEGTFQQHLKILSLNFI